MKALLQWKPDFNGCIMKAQPPIRMVLSLTIFFSWENLISYQMFVVGESKLLPYVFSGRIQTKVGSSKSLRHKLWQKCQKQSRNLQVGCKPGRSNVTKQSRVIGEKSLRPKFSANTMVRSDALYSYHSALLWKNIPHHSPWCSAYQTPYHSKLTHWWKEQNARASTNGCHQFQPKLLLNNMLEVGTPKEATFWYWA